MDLNLNIMKLEQHQMTNIITNRHSTKSRANKNNASRGQHRAAPHVCHSRAATNRSVHTNSSSSLCPINSFILLAPPQQRDHNNILASQKRGQAFDDEERENGVKFATLDKREDVDGSRIINDNKFSLTNRSSNNKENKSHTTTIRRTRTTQATATTATSRPRNMLVSKALILLPLGLMLAFFLSTGFLHVNGIRLQPEGKERFHWSGETFVITCQNSNNIKNVKIRWFGPNGQLIPENRSQRVHAVTSGPHVSRLEVHNTTLGQDEGTYKCTIGSTDDPRPREITEFSLRLFKATSFKATKPKLALSTDRDAEINCEVEFDQNVAAGTVSWFKDGKSIDMLNDASIRVLDYQPEKQLSQLILTPVRREHEGVYTCQATSVTPHLSKLNNFDIQLEINYAPIFETLEQTIWVESNQAMASRLAGGGSLSRQRTGNKYAEPTTAGHMPMMAPKRIRGQQNRINHMDQQSEIDQTNNNNSTGELERIVRVELRCVCQANPPADIKWSAKQLIVGKGSPNHVVEEPTHEVSGHNTSSVLVVAYNLDTDWPHRDDEYKCSAANTFGEATKKYTIRQGNPPPAFHVGHKKSYNAESAMFEFTLLGPNFDSQQNNRQQQGDNREIVPPVDAFRIRAEFGTTSENGAPTNGNGQTANKQQQSQASKHSDMLRRQSEPSVQFSYPQQQKSNYNRLSQQTASSWTPQSFNISLSKLPTGMQRLYLEAHNAVGWSPNGTHLGDFYLVSGSTSSGPAMSHNTILVLCQVITSLLALKLFDSAKYKPTLQHQKIHS